MGVLYARVNDAWVEVAGAGGGAGATGPIGPAGATGPTGPPGPTAVSADANNAAVLGTDALIFVPASAGDEVAVVSTDPYITDPASTAEMWLDTTDDPGTLYARVGGDWQKVTQREVFVDDEDPLTRVPPSPEAELWYDTLTNELKVQHPTGTWTLVTSPPPPDEVIIDTNPVDPLTATQELWFDPDAIPTSGGGSFDQAAADLLYVSLTGDAMTGTLNMDGPAPSIQVREGGVVHGVIETAGQDLVLRAPTDSVSLYGTYGVSFWPGGVTVGSPPVEMQPTAMEVRYPLDVGPTGAPWMGVDDTAVTTRVPVVLPADPANPLEATTKQYTDTKWTMWMGTQVAYDAIATKDPATLYVITA